MSGEHPYFHQASGTGPYSQYSLPQGAHLPPGSAPPPAPGAPAYGFRGEPSQFGQPEMMGVVGGPQPAHPPSSQYQYSDPSMDHSRGIPSSGPQFSVPYYGGPQQIPGPEADPSRHHLMVEGNPISPHHPNGAWERPRGSLSRPPSQHNEHNFPHHHNLAPSPRQQGFNRPQHLPMEPIAAPSPPSHFPSSPRTPIPMNHMGQPLSGPPSQYQPNGNRNLSISAPSTNGIDGRHFAEPTHPSPLRSPLDQPQHVPRFMNGTASAPPSANPFSTPSGQPTPPAPSYTHHRGSFGDGQRPELHRGPGSDDGRMIKREDRSRPPSVDMSPRGPPMGYADKQSPQEEQRLDTGEQKKTRSAPAFHDPNTNTPYYENEIVPPGVQIPSGYQRGTGKVCKDVLLPMTKDGIQVNPEWGLTAGGKARQRLPTACANCRQKKIKCQELEDYDGAPCQHCHKMRITCQKLLKDVDNKRKQRSSLDKSVKSEGRSASVSSIPDSVSKKRKTSLDPSTRDLKKANQLALSRGSSMSRDVDITRANYPHGMASPGPHSAPVRLDGRPPLFPTVENGMVSPRGHEIDPYESRQKHLEELRENNLAPARFPPESPRMPPSSPAASSFSGGSGVIMSHHPFPPPPPSAPSVHSMQSYRSKSDKTGSDVQRSSTPATMMGTPGPVPPIYPMRGTDPRHSHLPEPGMLNILVNAYFQNIYSQTYAFLHKPTFMRDMDKHPPILLFSICAIAARFTQQCTPDMAETWAKMTRDLIMENYDTYTLDVCQSMVHMGLHDFGTNTGHKAWIFCGMAIRMGSAMNLNLERKGKSTIQREVSRRTYWSYYLMDRFNSYGVARPYLIQDHDCHIQLPCNQPSFIEGKAVDTQHLHGPNLYAPKAGTEYMGAFAFLVRITSIWADILRQIHFTSLQPPNTKKWDKKNFHEFHRRLEEWRTSLPVGLAYSSENLVGQIEVGTTGAFVMMHVMWHNSMAYLYRYIGTSGMTSKDLESDQRKSEYVVESIRKAFVHADAILQVMSHVRVRMYETRNDEEPIIVNAPFLGQAVFDACTITITRAVQIRNEPGGARDQKDRVFVGLEWLKDLKKYWKPIHGMYKSLKKMCSGLESHMSNPPSQNFRPPQAPTPESSTDSNMYQQNQWLPLGTEYDDTGMAVSFDDGGLLNPMTANDDSFRGYPAVDAFLAVGDVPHLYNEAFAPQYTDRLTEYALTEAGFPDLYQHVTTASFDATLPATLSIQASLPGAPMALSIANDPNVNGNHPNGSGGQNGDHTMSFHAPTDRNDDSDDDDDDNDPTNPQPSGGGSAKDIHTTYFDPLAVHDGKLQDSASDTSGHSRRASESGGVGGMGMGIQNPRGPVARMDLLHLLNTVEGKVANVLPQKHDDKFTGPGGRVADEAGMLAGGGSQYGN